MIESEGMVGNDMHEIIYAVRDIRMYQKQQAELHGHIQVKLMLIEKCLDKVVTADICRL